jgi:preprotein translocase subunit SecE
MARTQRRRAASTPDGAGQPATPARRPRESMPRTNATPGTAGISRPEARRRKNPFGFLKRLQPRFAADVIAELRKVTWPSFQETRYLTIVVAFVAVLMGLFLGGIDLFFGWIIERLFF